MRRRRRKKSNLYRQIFLFMIITLSIFLVIKFRDSKLGQAREKDDPIIDENEGNREPEKEPADERKPLDEDPTNEDPPEQEPVDFSKLLDYKRTRVNLNVRKDPSIDSQILVSIPANNYVKYYGTIDGWDRVQYQGIDGYATEEYLEFNTDENMIKVVDGILIVNKNYGLPQNFDPGLDKETEFAFNDMREGAKKDNIILNIGSGYRSYNYQKNIFENSVKVYGLDLASTYSSKPGYSEHQTGLAIDIMGTDRTTRINPNFDNTEEAKWLADNAYKYGFILRYPKGKEDITGYMFESWHYRYVGKELAREIFQSGLTLEEYLGLE